MLGKADVVRVGERTVRAESFLDKWGFPARSHRTPVRLLSGGERAQVLLARLMSKGGNVLFLDEPTNDLDLATLRALEEALIAFPGSVVVVSHDRWFLDRVATQILYLDGEGGARVHHGDLSGLLEELARERAAASAGGTPGSARGSTKKAARSSGSAASTAAVAADGQGGPGAQRRKRISPWEQKELDQVEGRIAEVEAEVGQVDVLLADPALYGGPREQAEVLHQRRAGLAEDLAQLYARWEELEELRSGGA